MGLGSLPGGSNGLDLRADAGGGDFPLAPGLDPQGETKRGRTTTVLDFGEPALAGGAEAERHGALLQGKPERIAMCGEIHAAYSPEVNIGSRMHIHFRLTDATQPFSDNVNMAAPEKSLWYLQEWFATQDKIQRTLVTELGWLPGKAHKIWHGIQEPKPSEMHEIAALLNIRPHELMMHPEEAMRIRRLEAAVREVAKETSSVSGDANDAPATGSEAA